MKKSKVTKRDVDHKLSRVLFDKYRLDKLKKEQLENERLISLLEDKVSRGLSVCKKLKEKAVEDKEKPQRFIKKYSTEAEGFLKRILGKKYYDIINTKYRKIINIANKIYEVYDNVETFVVVKYRKTREVTRKIVRLPKRVIEWLPVLYEDWDWGFNSILPIILFKLDKLQKCLQNGYYIGCENDARDVRVLMEHIKRYQDIDKYTLDYEHDPVLDKWDFQVIEVDEYGRPLLYAREEKYPERSKQRMRIFMHQEELQQWHWNIIWKMISEKGQHWLS